MRPDRTTDSATHDAVTDAAGLDLARPCDGVACPEHEHCEVRGGQLILQKGVAGYSGAADTFLERYDQPEVPNGSGASLYSSMQRLPH